MRIVGGFLVLPVALFAWLHWSTSRIESELRPIASAVAGHPIEVDCQGYLSSLVDVQNREGEVRFDANGIPKPKIFLTRPTCKRLDAFAHSRHHPALDCLAKIDWAQPDPLPPGSLCEQRASPTVYALLILAHESYHTAGVIDEVTTNCYAIQAMAYVASRLGATLRESELAALAMDALEPHQIDGYATTDCRPGTAIDLHPETPAFPTELPLAPPGLPLHG
jgi:hypothetical protein